MPSGPKRRRAAKNKTIANPLNQFILPKVEPVDEENALEYSVKIEKGLPLKTEPLPSVELVEPAVESPGVGLVEPVAELSFDAEVGLVEKAVESPEVDLVEPVVESAVVGIVESVVESPMAVVGLDHEPVVESFLPVVDLVEVEPFAESSYVAEVGLVEQVVESPGVDVVESAVDVGLDEPLFESSLPVVCLDQPVVESCVGGCIECCAGVVVDDAELLSKVNGDLQAILVEDRVYSINEILVLGENGSVPKNSGDSGVKLMNVELGEVKKSIEEQIRIVEQVTANLRQILANFD